MKKKRAEQQIYLKTKVRNGAFYHSIITLQIALLLFTNRETHTSSAFSIDIPSLKSSSQKLHTTTTNTVMKSARYTTLVDLERPNVNPKKGPPLHIKQIVKKIQACGNDYTAALGVLHTTQPFLKPRSKENTHETEVYKGPFDAKAICGVIHLLSKNNQYSLALDLLQDTIHQHNAKIIPSHYLNAVFRAIIGMWAKQEQKMEYKQKNYRKIQRCIYYDIPYHTNQAPPIDIYHAALCALGKCRQIDAMLDLLKDLESLKDTTIPSTAEGTCLRYKHPAPDRFVYLTALTASIRCKSPSFSVEIMNRMVKRGMKFDEVAYSRVLSSLTNTKSEGRYEMAKTIWKEMEKDNACSDASYKSLIRVFSKEDRWDDVTAAWDRLKCLSNRNGNDNISVDVASIPVYHNINSPAGAPMTRYVEDLAKLERIIVGKRKWYKLGSVISIKGLEVVFGLQPHRNPVLNGLSLVFHKKEGEKLGFMLIRNQWEELLHKQENVFFSSILGMFVDEKHRDKGLAKIFLGIWLQICLNLKAFPRSEKINKPLVSLVLTRFGFIPTSESAIEIEISPLANIPEHGLKMNDLSWKPLFALYSRCPLNFGERELRTQKMVVSRQPPSPKGKLTKVRTTFEHPITQKVKAGENYAKEADELSQLIGNIWDGQNISSTPAETSSKKCSSGIHFDVDNQLLHRIIFGYLL